MNKIKSRYVCTSNGYVKLYIPGLGVVGEHRYIMEQHLGRKLGYNEIVHHKDENKQNNVLGNLEVVDRSPHAREHSSTGKTMVGLKCAYCGRTFARELREFKFKFEHGQRDFYCGRSCAARTFGRSRSK